MRPHTKSYIMLRVQEDTGFNSSLRTPQAKYADYNCLFQLEISSNAF